MCNQHELPRLFPKQYALLEGLFGGAGSFGCGVLRRMDAIYARSRADWEANRQRILRLNARPRFLLIGEAPPLPKAGTPNEINYFYTNFQGEAWCRQVWRALIPIGPIQSQCAARLEELASAGFLLVDSLPFPAEYTSQIRASPKYTALLESCAGYLMGQLDSQKIPWGSQIKIALAWTRNGRAMIGAYPGGLSIAGAKCVLTASMIAADASGYTSSERLREIWGL